MIRWYLCLETRFIDGIFAWKGGCLGECHGTDYKEPQRKRELNQP